MALKLNESGQAFPVYRLIIGGAIAFMILLIIMGAISYFEAIKTGITHDSLKSGLNAARDSPNAAIIQKKSVYFNVSVYTKGFFTLQSGIPEECLELSAWEGDPNIIITKGELGEPSGTISFERPITMHVFFRCALKGIAEDQLGFIFPDECLEVGMVCQISFGQPFD